MVFFNMEKVPEKGNLMNTEKKRNDGEKYLLLWKGVLRNCV